jgi:hypothetical protein
MKDQGKLQVGENRSFGGKFQPDGKSSIIRASE